MSYAGHIILPKSKNFYAMSYIINKTCHILGQNYGATVLSVIALTIIRSND